MRIKVKWIKLIIIDIRKEKKSKREKERFTFTRLFFEEIKALEDKDNFFLVFLGQLHIVPQKACVYEKRNGKQVSAVKKIIYIIYYILM